MDLNMLRAQITRLAPELRDHEVNGYLLEFMNDVMHRGSKEIIDIDTSGFKTARRSIKIPTDVTMIHEVYQNGRPVPQSLKEADVIYNDTVLGTIYVLADPYDDSIIADYDGTEVGIL
jgi:hypothetical protein